MPTVSVLIPARNAAPWLRECLQSVQGQSLPDWECLLLDDGSSDSTADIMREFAASDQRFRLVQAGGSGLISANMDLLAAARGRYVTRMDADDLMPPQRLQHMCSALDQAPPKTLVTGMVKFFPEAACGPGTRFYEDWLNERCVKNDHWQHIWRECVIPSPCWLARRDELITAGGLHSEAYPEDYDMAFRLYFAGFRVQGVQEVCHLWRQHSDRHSRKSGHYSAENFMRMKWNYWKQHHARAGRPVIILGTMDKGKMLKNMVEADGFEVVWLAHKPHIAGNIIDRTLIRYFTEYSFGHDDKLISTLSSIDNHDNIYANLESQGVFVFKFS